MFISSKQKSSLRDIPKVGTLKSIYGTFGGNSVPAMMLHIKTLHFDIVGHLFLCSFLISLCIAHQHFYDRIMFEVGQMLLLTMCTMHRVHCHGFAIARTQCSHTQFKLALYECVGYSDVLTITYRHYVIRITCSVGNVSAKNRSTTNNTTERNIIQLLNYCNVLLFHFICCLCVTLLLVIIEQRRKQRRQQQEFKPRMMSSMPVKLCRKPFEVMGKTYGARVRALS